MKKILLIIATHGDEKIGLEIIKGLKKQKNIDAVDYLIANPRALASGVRFIDYDLNRAYPGDKDSLLYEKRRAAEILEKAREYQYVIDLHEASHGSDDFIILPRESRGNFPLELINLKTVLFWPDPKGPLGDVLENAIELEFGMKNKNRAEVVARATEIIVDFITAASSQGNIKAEKKDFYQVYGKLVKGEKKIEPGQLIDFSRAIIEGEEFYPLLTGQYLKDKILCYKMKKIS